MGPYIISFFLRNQIGRDQVRRLRSQFAMFTNERVERHQRLIAILVDFRLQKKLEWSLTESHGTIRIRRDR